MAESNRKRLTTFLPNEDSSIGHLDDNNNIHQVTISSSDHIIPSLSRDLEASSSVVAAAASLQGETDTGVSGGHKKNNKSYFKRLHLTNKKAKVKIGRSAKRKRMSPSLPLSRTGDPSIAYVDNQNIEVIVTKPSHHTPSLSNHGQQTPREEANLAAGDPSVAIVNDNNIEVIISPSHHSLSHNGQQTSREAYSAAASLHGETVTVINETPLEVDMGSRHRELYEYALQGKWEGAKSIYDKYPDMVRIPLTASGDTALHVADVAIELFDKYPAILATARDKQEKLTALHLLAQKPSHESKYNQEEQNSKAEGSIFNVIADYLHDKAKKILFPCLVIPVSSINDNSQEKNEASQGEADQLQLLLEKLWSQVRQLEYREILELVTVPSAVLFDAVKSGNNEVVKWLLYMNPGLLKIMDLETGQNLLHVAALYRRKSIFDFILKMKTANLLIRAVDHERNNVLHFAASQQNEASANLRPNIQMHTELLWFKEAEEKVPLPLRTMKNKKGQTPKYTFYDHHSTLSKEVKDAATGIANSGMIVAVLIVAVAFAAAVAIPGNNMNNNWFKVFMLANAVAIFTSSASIVSFLSIFTSSRFTDSEYIIAMHPCVKLGLTLVLISIAAMVVAFVAASLLIFAQTAKWVGYVVGFLGILPVTLLVIQFSFSKGLIDYLFWSRYYHLSKIR